MDKTNKKKRIVTYCIVLAVVLFAVFVIDLLSYNTGVVSNITVANKNVDLELQMTYLLPMGGYTVREVPQDEGEYIGDGMIDYDGSLGQYRIMIEFGDVEPHTVFVRSMFRDGIYELKRVNVSLKMKIAQPSDHGFVLYIGSDTPIHLEETSSNKLDGLFGIIKIPILIGKTE